MSCGISLCFFKPVLVVAGIAAVGMGGYNFAVTGCPLGGCGGETASRVRTVAAPASEKPECCSGESSESSPAMLVSATVESSTPAGACAGEAAHCSPEMKAACEATGSCPVSAEACEGMDPEQCEQVCPHAAAGQIAGTEAVEQQAETGSGEG